MRARSRADVTITLALLVALGAFGAGPAHAEPTPDERTLAEALFREGKRLMDEGRHAEACPKLAESQSLDPGGGTLLNLALCHEAEGRLATAWSELRDALAIARRDGRRDREELALTRIAELEPRLSRLVVMVAGFDLETLEVRRGGAVVPRVAWGTALPVDPGTHVVEASAPGYQPFRTEIVVGAEAKTYRLDIPALEPAVELPPNVPSPPEGQRRGLDLDLDLGRLPPRPPPPPPDTTQRTAGIVLTFVGVAAGVMGTIAGAVALERKLASDDACRGGCTVDGVEANEDAAAAAIVADVGLGAGLVISGVGVALWLTAPSPPAPADPPAGASSGLRVTFAF